MHSTLLLAASLSFSCESAQVELHCHGEACASVPAEVPQTETPAPETPAPESPLPVPPVVVSTACEHPHSVTWQASDLANTQPFEQPCLTERLDDNGCVGERIEHRFDARGLVVRTRTWTRRLGTGTTIEERHEFTLWPDGTTRTELYEQTVNGERISQRALSEFDAAGRELSMQRDRNVDGIYESGRIYTYDASGNRLSERTYDGQRTLRDMRYRFGAEGRELERIDAVRATIVRTTYESLRKTVSTSDLDGVPINEVTTVYDNEAHVLSVEADWDGDGQVDERFENAWSEAGLLLGSRADRDAEGVWDYASAQMYDRAGQLLHAMSDADNDARPERAELHSYACLLPTP